MSVSSRASSEAEFPEPHRFGMWRGGYMFQVYRNLSLVKAAVTAIARNGTVGTDVKIYEHDGERWQLIYHLPPGTVKSEHELWKNGAKAPKTLAVSDESVNAAIASILGNTPTS